MKSADAPNDPHPLEDSTAEELSKLPDYYVMPLDMGMSETVSGAMSLTAIERANQSKWLTDIELQVYVREFGRTGFQGGLNWYHVATNPELMQDIDIFAGKRMEVPLLFIAGTKDWLPYQVPGSLKRMHEACDIFGGNRWIEGAGHWVQQEQPERVVLKVLDFLQWADLQL